MSYELLVTISVIRSFIQWNSCVSHNFIWIFTFDFK